MFRPFPKIPNRPPRGSEHVQTWKAFVKLHGTNAAIHVKDGEMVAFQSRNRLITPDDDNQGFAQAMTNLAPKLDIPFENHIIYGEWAGQGIQSNVAISNIPKTFFPFAVFDKETGNFLHNESYRVDYMRRNNESTWKGHLLVPYDTFGRKDMERLEAVVKAIDAVCPVGLAFGHEGHGEGLVLRPVSSKYEKTNLDLWWKAKGKSHQGSGEVKQFKAPQFGAESAGWIHEQVDKRARQGLEYLVEMNHPLDSTSTPIYIKWMIADIKAEEEIPDFVNPKAIGGVAARFYKELSNGTF